MKIMFYEYGKYSVYEFIKMFEIFKKSSEAEGEIAIALPSDIEVWQNIPKERLIEIRDTINNIIERSVLSE